MSFFPNANNFVVNGGNYTSHNVHHHWHVVDRNDNGPSTIEGPPSFHSIENGSGYLWEENIQIITREELQLTHELRSGPGYFLHAGKHKNCAVIVKIFNPGPNSRKKLESTMTLSRTLMHPNLLAIKGVSSPASPTQFMAYHHGSPAVGPLAAALQNGLSTSIALGFQLIAELSLGLNYLSVQHISPRMIGIENFDVVVDQENRFLICFTPRTFPHHPTESDSDQAEDDEGWETLNGLCEMVLKDANRVVHDDEIQRDTSGFDLLGQNYIRPQNSLPVSLGPAILAQTAQDASDLASVPPRREYVWRTIPRGTQSLATIARCFSGDFQREPSSNLRRLTRTNQQSPHRCAGYVREEITLAVAPKDSAVVSHDSPSPLEICSVCHEIVGSNEVFQCICGDSNPGSGSTSQCRVCKTWSHSICVAAFSKNFTCSLCVPSPPSPLTPGARAAASPPLFPVPSLSREKHEAERPSGVIDEEENWKEEKDDLEKSVEALRAALRQQETTTDKFKEENWNLEVTLQELRSQLSAATSAESAASLKADRLAAQHAAFLQSAEFGKYEAEHLNGVADEMKAKHEADVATHRKAAAGLLRDKSDLQGAIDKLKAEAARAGRRGLLSSALGSPFTPNGDASDFLIPAHGEDDLFATGGASTRRRAVFDDPDSEGDQSPDASPIPARGQESELEMLRQKLAHAQRQISTLKGTLRREKEGRRDSPMPSPMASRIGVDDDEVEDDDEADATIAEKSRQRLTPSKVGGARAGRGRGARGRGGMSLMQRLSMAEENRRVSVDVNGMDPAFTFGLP